MNDGRKKLEKGVRLYDKGRKIIIGEETGRGASCIVYDADYIDDIGQPHFVRIKECYPDYLLLERKDNGDICALESDRVRFDEAKERFVAAYSRNARIRNTVGLVNSTINTGDLFQSNQTYYIRMSFDEGTDYRTYQDASLKELFGHIGALAELIKKYHENGYLHLDIKPENIFVIPETEAHVLLFDFDTVVTMEELKQNKRLRLSFSDGFSAPEQKQGRVNKIGCHTDIYGIGAVAFYKVFGRKPELGDGMLSAQYDFSGMRYADQRFQPKLYRKMTEFFRKTLSTSSVSRWNSLEPVITAVKELAGLADVEQAFVFDSFQYQSGCFIGRENDITDIHQVLQDHQLVFLSGIGGIGKTEIARRYAKVYREHYDTVVFAVYESSVMHLVNQDILVSGVGREEQEEDGQYFVRKLNILKELLTPDDLIIIDNFDTDQDENLEQLLECNCKFIITTREDFRDYNYPQLEIGRMECMEEVVRLFEAYNDGDYAQPEKEAIEQIITLVDSHTMTVELTAKYLRDTDELPSVLYERFLEKEGVTNTGEIRIRQRKDRKLRSESFLTHIRILFDMSDFSLREKTLIRSLSLLGGIRISKARFQELCHVSDDTEALHMLVRRGWMEYDKLTDKVSPHQIIQDLVYRDLKPNAENCPDITESMISFAGDGNISDTERRLRHRVVSIFMERLTGNSPPYAELCICCGKEQGLELAEKICLKSTDKKSFDLLRRIYQKKMVYAVKCSDLFESNMELDEYCRYKYREIAGLLDQAVDAARKYSDEPEYLAKTLAELAMDTELLVNEGVLCCTDEQRIEELDILYRKIIQLLDTAADYILKGELSLSDKTEMLAKIRDFYMEWGISMTYTHTALYRWKYYTDASKAAWYQEQIQVLKKCAEKEKKAEDNSTEQKKGIHLSADNIIYIDLAYEYENKGDCARAIEYYEKAYANGEETYDMTWQSIARIYEMAGNIQKAAAYLKKILEADKAAEARGDQFFSYSAGACCDLIRLLRSEQRFQEACDYAHEMIYYCELKVFREKNSYYTGYILAAYYYLYQMEVNADRKADLWNECIRYYQMLDPDEDFLEEIHDFILDYVKSLDVSQQADSGQEQNGSWNDADAWFIQIRQILKRTGWRGEKLKEDIFQHVLTVCSKKKAYRDWHVYFLIQYSRFLQDSTERQNEKAFQYCRMGLQYYDEYNMQKPYYQSLLYEIMESCMCSFEDCDYKQIQKIRKKCNYALIARTETKEYLSSVEEKYKAWEHAADAYERVECFQKEVYCLQKAVDIMKPCIGLYKCCNVSSYWRLSMQIISCYRKLKNREQVYFLVKKLYDEMLWYYIKLKKERNQRELIWKMREIAECLEENGYAAKAADVYLYAAYIAASEAPDFSLVLSLRDDSRRNRCVYEQLKTLIQAGLADQVIDDLAELKEKIMPLLKQHELGVLYGELMQWFAAHYEYREIEFKVK